MAAKGLDQHLTERSIGISEPDRATATERQIGTDLELFEANIYYVTDSWDDQPLEFRLGRQVLTCGHRKDVSEFVAAINEGRESRASISQLIDCYRVLHEVEQQFGS